MPDEKKAAARLEIAHVLFLDIVGYSKLLIDEQSEALHELNQIVRKTEAARTAEAAGQLIFLPTGDGMALVFTGSVEDPVECALEISQALRAQPSLPVRMGIHSGPVQHVADVNQRGNVAGAGINIAQRVMDCGDAGHILVSKRVADDLSQSRRWQPYLHELGDFEVKHGVIVSVVNLYADVVGNPEAPAKFRKAKSAPRAARVSPPSRWWPIVFGLLLICLAVPAIIFTPAILKQKRADGRTRPDPAILASAPAAVLDKSIAVLPLLNQSGDPAQEYFSDGLSEELINVLGQIRELRVIGRNSSFRFKGKTDDSRAIGQALRVAHVLEGSVRKAGDRVRINVQLVDTSTDSQRWSQTYDRELKDVFAVQEEIAKSVADQLRVTLVGHADAGPANRNLNAYNAYLQGRFYFGQRNAASYAKALPFFEEAIRLDPNYAEAYAAKARTHISVAGGGVGGKPAFEEARRAALTALSLKPDLAEARGALGFINVYVDCNLAAAEAELSRVQTNDGATFNARSALHEARGDQVQATALEQKAIDVDPLFVTWYWNMAGILIRRGLYDEAEATLRKADALQPGAAVIHSYLSLIAVLRGQGDVALREAELLESNNHLRNMHTALAQHVRGDRAAADAALASLIEKSGADFPSRVATVYASRGEADKTFEWLNRAYELRQPAFHLIATDPFLRPYRADPRYVELCRKANLPVPK